ncbi:MAG: hypothetical protein EZS28_045145, partial [Streblomastix strix]
MAGCSSTDYNILQCIPSIKPFVLLSRHGWLSCIVPVRYDQTPFRDLGMRIVSSAVNAANFAHKWRNPQSQLFPSYSEYEANKYRKYVQMEIDEELSEAGTLTIRPKYPIMRYHTPILLLRQGRYFDSQTMIGISPLPLQCENLKWRTLEPWQIRKVVTMFGAEGDVRERWKLSERERVRNQLGLIQIPIKEKKDNNKKLNSKHQQNRTQEQKQNLIKLLKEIRNKEEEEEDVKKRYNQLRSDIIETNSQFNEQSNQPSSIQQPLTIPLLKSKAKLLSTQIYPEITSSNTELTINQPTLIHLQEQMSPQYQTKNEILTRLS